MRARVSHISASRATAWVVLAVLGVAGACLDHDAADPSGGSRVHLSLSASIAGSSSAAGRSVGIHVFYRRGPNNETVALFNNTFDVDVGTRQLPIAVDIGPCLTDPNRAGAPAQRCVVHLAVVLRDAAGAPVDSQSVGPLDAVPGTTLAVPPLTLSEETIITVVSGGDQIGFAGQDLMLPVEVKVAARGDVALPDRPLLVTSLSGGGGIVTQGIRTGADGVARFSYRTGSAAGVNTFRVTVPGLIGAEAVVSARGISPARSSVAAGSLFSCLLDASRKVRCAGDNTYGTLGNPVVVRDTSLLVPIASTRDFVSVVAGTQNNVTSRVACGLTVDGDVYCWGTNEGGTLGVSSTDTCPPFGANPLIPRCAKSPALVLGAPKFVSISIGGGVGLFTVRGCGVTVSGEAYCWGEGERGELGHGANASTAAPVRVAGPEKWVQVSTGQTSTCGIAATGAMYCWGANDVGQLGNGSTTPSNVPVRVEASLRFVAVSVGSRTTCAVSIDGHVYCWGASVVGGPPLLQPGPSAGQLAFSSISFGISHVCGVTPAGDAYCAGSGVNGALGNGSTLPSPGPAAVLGGLRFTEVSAGSLHSCGLTIQSDMYCWGNNSFGEFATGYRSSTAYVPVRANLTSRTPGAAARLEAGSATIIAPVSVGSSVGSTFQSPSIASVRVVDQDGFGVPGVPVTFTVTSGGGSIGINSLVTGVGGFLRLPPWRVGPTVGLNSLTVSAPGLAGTPLTFTVQGVSPGPATRMDWFGCCVVAPRELPPGSQVPLPVPGVTIRDAGGLVVAGVPVTFTLLRPGSRITPASPATIATDSDGMAGLSSWTLDVVPRVDTLTATSPGLPTVYFVVTTLPRAPFEAARRATSAAIPSLGPLMTPWPIRRSVP